MPTKSWRGQRNQITTGPDPSPVPGPEKVYIFPAFSLNWPVAWDRITNGERVVTQTFSSPDQKTTEFEVPEFKCRRALESTMGVIPPPSSLRPEGAASATYARL